MSAFVKYTNSLINEDSVYLLQHAHNPVNWLPWNEEALSKAKHENKPIFLSIGYSACHWCHVMEREVFENEELAQKLNDKFICIKIDKEERPDLDKHFQLVYQLMSKRAGGWPTSIFLTKNQNPFFVGTYIPPTPKHGMQGFGEIIDFLYEKHEKAFAELDKRAEGINAVLDEINVKNPQIISFDIKNRISNFVANSFDKTDGGILGEPKFPHASLLDYMLLSKDKFLVQEALFTLKKMSRGGMYDIIDGGFCRYSVDSFWVVPHFEKMLYDNGALIGTYANAYNISKDEYFLNIAKECVNFLCEKMQDESGLFYSASDADTNGHEGEYFVYSYKEAVSAMEANGIDVSVLKTLGFSKIGNFEGKNIAVNENLEQSEDVRKAIAVLKDMRKSREYPIIDTKLLVSWNALAISGVAKLALIDRNYEALVLNLIDAVEKELIIQNELYHTKTPNKKPKIKAFLEDYAFLAKAYIDIFALTKNDEYKQKAQNLTLLAKEKFYDNGLWKFSIGEFTTYAESMDASYISPIALICEALIFCNENKIAQTTIEHYSKELKDYTPYNAGIAYAWELLNEH